MNIAELIALAKIRSGKSQKEMAEEIGYPNPSYVSKIATGQKAPDASEIIYFARAAKMDELATLASIESKRHPELAQVWQDTLTRAQQGLRSFSDVI